MTTEERLRISLNLIAKVKDLDLSHAHGEAQSVWDARETVRRFVNGEALERMMQLTELECTLLGYLLRTEKAHTETGLLADDLPPFMYQRFQKRLEVIQSVIDKVEGELLRLERMAETKNHAISDAAEAGE